MIWFDPDPLRVTCLPSPEMMPACALASAMFLFLPCALIHWMPEDGYRNSAYEDSASLATTIWNVFTCEKLMQTNNVSHQHFT